MRPLLVTVFTATTLACAPQPKPPPATCAGRTGGAFIQFEVNKEPFRLWISDPAFIARARELAGTGEPRTALFRRLRDGRDCDDRWSWHVDPAEAEWPDLTTEVCDGRPSDIEGNKAYWLETVKRYCPWKAVVVSVSE